ncbi:MAG: HAD family hydrolase [Solobacterium sp.]|nr:HAD family hydrolase [Solobacterium sp.]
MKHNYLFFDIDGTLVDPKTGLVPRSAMDAINAAQAKGSLVFICSGRPYYEIMDSFGIKRDGAIFSSGAGFELNGKLVLKRVFDPALAKFVMDKAEEFHVGYSIHCLERGYSDPIWRKMVFDKIEGLPAQIANRLLIQPAFNCGNLPLDKYAGEDIYKVNVQYFPGSDREGFVNAVAPHTTFVPINSQSNNSNSGCEISPIDVNKGTGVLMVATHYLGDMADTYGFGDSLNDLEMIRECGHGIVMGNGQDEVKALAEFVTTDVDKDGVANALRHYGLC